MYNIFDPAGQQLSKGGGNIFSKFLDIKPEKQERIINAALKEFSQKGFEKASTNEIVKNAEISKGLLFHYFHNKKELFLFLYDYSLDVVTKEFFEKVDFSERDLFTRFRQMSLLKLELIKKYPEMLDFVLTAYLEESTEVKSELNANNMERLNSIYIRIFQDIDTTRFKDGIDVKRAIQIFTWTMEGYSLQKQKELKIRHYDEIDADEMFREIDIYVDLLKGCFYK